MITKSQRNFKAGFTLIELLVVMAIIGILSAIVLTSLNSARNKGSNATIKSNLSNARSQSELYYDTNDNLGGYIGLCVSGGTSNPGGVKSIYNQFKAASDASNATAVSTIPGFNQTALPQPSTTSACRSNTGAWAISIPLKTPEGPGGNLLYWCVDSTGTAGGRINGLSNSGISQYQCPAS